MLLVQSIQPPPPKTDYIILGQRVYGEHIDRVNTLPCAKNCCFSLVEPANQHEFLEPCQAIEIDPQTTQYTTAITIRTFRKFPSRCC